MRPKLELPRLSLAEKDRRWTAVRREMKARGLQCLILWGWPVEWDFGTANARYLCPIGGNAEKYALIFPLHGDPTCFVLMPTFVDYWKSAQDWVPDVRSKQGDWAASVSRRVEELGLDNATIGIDGLGGCLDPEGWLPYRIFERLAASLPRAKLVDLDGMIERFRTVKSAEEIQALDRAAALGDKMLLACRENARPGVRESDVYASMIHAMLADGGEEPTLFLWAADRYPLPHPFRLPTTRRLDEHDLILCEIHPKIGGYFTHVERTFSLGEPDQNIVRIYDACVEVFHRTLDQLGPGRSISHCLEEAEKIVQSAKLGICEMGFHGHGLGSLEYPRYRLHARKADSAALEMVRDSFEEGMVFAFNIDLFDPEWRGGKTGAVFAETILITASGARKFHSFPTTFQRIS